MRFLHFVIVFISFTLGAFAQKVFPVRSTLQVQYPSVFLDEYNQDGNMTGTVSLLDPSKDDYNVLVKLVVTGPDLAYETLTPIAITLKRSTPYELDFSLPSSDNSSASRLIDLNNLRILFEKTPGSLLGTKAMPEGIYTMKLEIYDANFPTINVSNLNTIATTVFAQRLQPPLLNMPSNNIFVEDGFPAQNLFFSWQPRSVVANPAIQVKYKFKLIEVVAGVDPYNAMNSAGSQYPTTLVEQDNLDFPSYQLSPESLPAITFNPGSTYAWQISAYELKDGLASTQRFTQNGRSEVYLFTIKENCDLIVPTDITSMVIGEDMEISWPKAGSHRAYEFSFRELGSLYAFNPVEISPSNDLSDRQIHTIPLANLQRGMEYEFKVRAKCRAWQPEVYGGTFRIPDSGCDTPEPIRVESTPNGVVLNWDAPANVTGYKLRYRGGPTANDTETIINIATGTTFTLPAITGNQKYSIKLDALCTSGDMALGKLYNIGATSTGYAGGCPIPMPFNLINELSDNGQQTTLKWSNSNLHKSYKLEIVLKSELERLGAKAIWKEYTSSFPQQVLTTLTNDVLYAYRITYICQNDQTSTTPIGYFKQAPNDPTQYIKEGTGNCFPPAVYTAEGKSATAADFEWDKSDNADKYQLFYAPKGTKDFEAFTTTQRSATIRDLGANGQSLYKYKIRCLCADGKYSLFTDTALVDLNRRYTGTCTYDYPLKSNSRSKTEVRLAWKHTEGTTYVVTYKEASQSLNSFYTKQISSDSIASRNLLTGDSIHYTINNLSPGTTYQFTMQPVCGTDQGKRTAPLSVTTLADDAPTGGCNAPILCSTKSKKPLGADSLQGLSPTSPGVFDYTSSGALNEFQSGDITVVVLDPLTKGDGTFTGVGIAKMKIEIPALGVDANATNNIRTNVAFKGIKINGGRCLIEGQVNVTSIDLSVLTPEQQAKAKEAVDQFNKAMEQTKGAIEDLKNVIAAGQDAVSQAENYLDGGTRYGNVKTGDIRTPPAGAAYSISGNTVTAGGQTIATLENDIAASDTVFCKKCNRITFSNPTTAKYDFDEYKTIYKDARKVNREYREIKVTPTSSYYVSAKALVAGQVDQVQVNLNGYSASNLKFKTKKGVVYTLSSSNTLTLAGGPAGDGQDLYVLDKTKSDSIVGRLLIAQYPSVTKNLVLVKVDNKNKFSPTRMAEIKTATESLLRTSYNRIGINYNISIDESFATETSWDVGNDGFVQDSKSGFLDNDFAGEEKALIKAYLEKNSSLDTNKIYLFVTPDGALAGGDLNGKMPRGKTGGFIFGGNNTSTTTLAKTVLHELAHGPHTLHHLFNSDWIGDSYKTNADNLMSYGNGSDLIKCQWDIMHDPGQVLGIFERDKDAAEQHLGELVTINDNMLNDDKATFSFLLSDGKVLTLDKKFKIKSITVGQSFDNFSGVRSYGDLQSFVEESKSEGKTTYKEYFIRSNNGIWGIFSGKLVENKNRENDLDSYYTSEIDYSKNYMSDFAKDGDPKYFIKALPSSNGNISLYKFVIDGWRFWDVSNRCPLQNVKVNGSINPLGVTQIERKFFVDFSSANSQLLSFQAPATKTLWGIDYNDIINLDYGTEQVLVQWYISKLSNIYPELFPVFTAAGNYKKWGSSGYNIRQYAELATNQNALVNLGQRAFDYVYNQVTDERFDFSMFGVFDIRYNTTQLLRDDFANNKLRFYNTFADSLEIFFSKQRNFVKSGLSSLTETTPRLEVLKILKVANDEDIVKLTVAKRILIIDKICEGTIWDNQEDYIVKLLDLLPNSSEGKTADSLIVELQNDYNNNTAITLYKRLTQNGSGIDDETFFKGNNNYRKFIGTIIKLAYRGDNFKNKIKALSDETDFKKFSEKVIEFKYYSFYQRLKDHLINSLTYGGGYVFLPSQVQTAVSVDNDYVHVENRHYNGFVPYVWQNVPETKFEYFEPVVIINETGLANTSGIGVNPNDYKNLDKSKVKDLYTKEIFPVPALALEYLDDKVDDELTADVINTVIDVATIWTGYGALAKSVTVFRRVVAVSDVTSSIINLGGNLSASAFANTDPRKKMVQDLSGALSTVVGLPSSLEIFEPSRIKQEELFASLLQSNGTGQLDWVKVEGYLTQVEIVANASVNADVLSNSYKAVNVNLLLSFENALMDASLAEKSGLLNRIRTARIALETKKSVSGVVASTFNFIGAIQKTTDQAKKAMLQSLSSLESIKRISVKSENGVWKIYFKKDATEVSIGRLLDETNSTSFVADASAIANPNAAKIEEVLADGRSAIVCDGGNCCVIDGQCFVANTMVETNSGMSTIEKIKVGDVVNSYNEIEKKYSMQKVVRVFKNTTEKLVKLFFGKDTIFATPEHPFYTQSGWVNAVDLRTSHKIAIRNGFLALLSSIAIDTNATVYNFEVENTHTYIVGNERIIVHNSCTSFDNIENNNLLTSDELTTFRNQFKGNSDLAQVFLSDPKALEAWKVLYRSGDQNLFTATQLKLILAQLGKVSSSANLATNTETLVRLYKSLSTVSKSNLLSLFTANANPNVLQKLSSWPPEFLENFFKDLMRQPGNVTPGKSGFLAANLDKVDEEILDIFKHFTDKEVVPDKKYDFDYLKGAKGLSDDELIQYLNLDTRAIKAAELASTYPNVSNLLRNTNYKNNLLKSITDLYSGNAVDLQKFIDIYANEPGLATVNALNALKGKSSAEVRAGLERIFNGTDFNAHHIIPVNLLYNSEVCKEIIEWAAKQVPPKDFKFHDMDNLIFLRDVNHTGDAFGHGKYDELLSLDIKKLKEVFDVNPEKAYNQYIDLVDEYKGRIVMDLIGSDPPKKLDDLK